MRKNAVPSVRVKSGSFSVIVVGPFEMSNVMDYGRFQPAIHPAFGPTRTADVPFSNYWSSIAFAEHAHLALFVNFDEGFTSAAGSNLPTGERGSLCEL